MTSLSDFFTIIMYWRQFGINNPRFIKRLYGKKWSDRFHVSEKSWINQSSRHRNSTMHDCRMKVWWHIFPSFKEMWINPSETFLSHHFITMSNSHFWYTYRHRSTPRGDSHAGRFTRGEIHTRKSWMKKLEYTILKDSVFQYEHFGTTFHDSPLLITTTWEGWAGRGMENIPWNILVFACFLV